MGTLKFASTLFLMSDVLPHVAMLSKRFQKESVAWYQIAAAVESTQDVLVAFKLSDSMYMQALIKELKLSRVTWRSFSSRQVVVKGRKHIGCIKS